jgi:hypothetical protein
MLGLPRISEINTDFVNNILSIFNIPSVTKTTKTEKTITHIDITYTTHSNTTPGGVLDRKKTARRKLERQRRSPDTPDEFIESDAVYNHRHEIRHTREETIPVVTPDIEPGTRLEVEQRGNVNVIFSVDPSEFHMSPDFIMNAVITMQYVTALLSCGYRRVGIQMMGKNSKDTILLQSGTRFIDFMSQINTQLESAADISELSHKQAVASSAGSDDIVVVHLSSKEPDESQIETLNNLISTSPTNGTIRSIRFNLNPQQAFDVQKVAYYRNVSVFGGDIRKLLVSPELILSLLPVQEVPDTVQT